MPLHRRHLFCALPALACPSLRADALTSDLSLHDGRTLLSLGATDLQLRHRVHLPTRPAPCMGEHHLWWTDGETLWQRHLRTGAQRPLATSPDGAPLQVEVLSTDGQILLLSSPQHLHLWSVPEGRWVARHATAPRGLAAVCAHPQRNSLLLAPRGVEAIWEIYLDPRAEDFYTGTVHDFQFGEGVPTRGHLGLRRMPLPQALTALRVHPAHFQVLATDTSGALRVLNLDARRPLRPRWPGADLARGCLCSWDGQAAWAQPLDAGIELIGVDRAERLATWALAADWLVGHPAAPWGWAAQGPKLVPWGQAPAMATPIVWPGPGTATAHPLSAWTDGRRLWVRWRQAQQAWLSVHDAPSGQPHRAVELPLHATDPWIFKTSS